jgi:cytochrome c biogenesis protein CcdA
MSFLIPSFLAGVLTVLAPCVFTLLPIILGGSAAENNMKKPLIIITSLSFSVILFSLILKGTTFFITVPQQFWATVSGGILVLFGLIMLFPDLWSWINLKLGLYKSEVLLEKSGHGESTLSAVLLGASLGPVFTTCSPTYALILAIILPANFIWGLINLLAYTLGLAFVLFLVAFGGQKFVKQMKFAVNPNGWLKKTLGFLILLVGVLIVTGLDKTLEIAILDTGYLDPIQLEEKIKSFFEST